MPTTTESVRADSPGVNLMPPMVFWACLIAGVVLALWLRLTIRLLPQPLALCVGSAVAIAGLLFMLWGNSNFASASVNVKPNLPASRLITGGAYRFSRNPMYVGFVSILAGVGIAALSIPILFSALPMFLYLECYVIRREEKYLTRVFGDDYGAYSRRVRRWL